MNDLDTRKIELLAALVVLFNIVIVVPAGHGLGCLGLFEVFRFPFTNDPDFTFSPSSYDESISIAAAFSLVGQVGLIALLCFKRVALAIFGLTPLYIGFIYLTHAVLYGDPLAIVSLLTGIPFMVVCFFLHVRLKIASASDGEAE